MDLKQGYTYTSAKFGSKVYSGFSDIFREEVFADVTLTVEGREFKAHRIILCSASRYFRAMFLGHMAEISKENVPIYGISANIFEDVLKFIYTGSVVICADKCVDLFEAADMLEIPDVVTACSDFLKENLGLDNCIGIYMLAESHGCIPLETAAESYIHRNFLQVRHSKEFTMLPKDTLLYLLRSDLLHIDNEFQVFVSALDWIQFDLTTRTKFVYYDLMATVRFPFIADQQIETYISNCGDLYLKIALKRLMHRRELNKKLFEELRLKLKPNPYFLRLDKPNPYPMHPRKSTRKSLIVFGGFSLTTCNHANGFRRSDLKNVELFDPFTQEWHSLPSMHHAGSGLGVAEINGCIYVIGGECNSLIYDNTDCYDPVSKVWSHCATLVSPRTGMGVCSLNGYLYALGGCDGSVVGDTVERFDPVINKWQVVDRLVTPRFSMAVLAYEGLIYVLGGMNDLGNELKTVESYNPVTHEWTKLASMSNRRAYVGAAVIDGQIYVAGGSIGYRGALSTVEKYSIEENCWTDVSCMSVPRAGASVCAVNGMMHVMGGRCSTSELSAPATLRTVECYDPKTDTWFEICDMPTSRCEAGIAVIHM